VVLLVAEGVAFVTYGRYNADEGLHLNAGRLVYADGLLLYRDFPFSQGPAGPYFYGAAGALFGSSVTTGRAASLALSLIGLGALTWLIRRISGTSGAALMLLFTATSFPALWGFTQVRTEAGAVALTSIAAVAFLLRGGGALRWALAPSLLVWATAFRLTHVIPLLFVCAVIAWDLRRSPGKLACTAGIVAASGLLAALPMLAFPDEALFHIRTSQLGRSERLGWEGLPFSARLQFFRSPEKSFAGLLFLTVLPLAYAARRWREGWRPAAAERGDPALVVCWLIVLALLTYLPLLVFRVGFASYFINASLLLTAAIAVAVPQLARRGPGGSALWAGVALVWVFTAVLAVRGAGTFVEPSKPTNERLAAVRRQIGGLAGADCTMLTLETQVAVETGCSVLRGLEYSRFSFFPDMPDAEALRWGVLNRRLLRQRLRDDPPEVLALTPDAFEQLTGSPRRRKDAPLFPELKGRYRPLTSVEIPIGTTFRFWKDVEFFVRADLVPERRGATRTRPRIRSGRGRLSARHSRRGAIRWPGNAPRRRLPAAPSRGR